MAARTYEQLLSIVQALAYPGFEFLLRHVTAHGDDGDCCPLYLQVQCTEGTCNVSGEPITWRGRKWLISRHMTDGEIVQTAFLAVMTALEHEARENFKYEGRAILDPHYDPNHLWLLRGNPESVQEREKA